MCTIVVTFNENKPQILRAMATAVKHRGPDSFEVWTNEQHGAAACRLSIFGDPNAHMIFQAQDTGQIVLLNGEIYNYQKLWDDLAKQGYYPKTNLETELIATLYRLYGLDFAKKMQGKIAIAIIYGSQ